MNVILPLHISPAVSTEAMAFRSRLLTGSFLQGPCVIVLFEDLQSVVNTTEQTLVQPVPTRQAVSEGRAGKVPLEVYEATWTVGNWLQTIACTNYTRLQGVFRVQAH